MSHFYYSDKYSDDEFEYRHVIVSAPEVRDAIPKGKLMTEREWRLLGVQQSRGWNHYLLHTPEPHILLFRRRLHQQTNQFK
eukprot:gene16770-18464_t